MRFAKVRQTATKGIDVPDPHNAATPRLLSPYKDRTRLVPREGVNPLDIPRPLHNRTSRRAIGVRGPKRRRIGGVALSVDQMPWRSAS